MVFQLFIGGLGGPELIIVFMLVILLFGANKLPKLARASGEAMSEFQRGRENLERDIRDAAEGGEGKGDVDEVGDDTDADNDLESDVDSDVTST